MNEEEALAKFEAYLAEREEETSLALGRTAEGPDRLSRGWAFFYQSREFLETGNVSDQLVGHGPVLVLDDGRIVEGGSLDWPPEAFLKRVW